jgi:pimeloyl-ACP methyl ester carboxylesterase
MPRKKPQPKPASRQQTASAPPTVSGRWLLTAAAISFVGAALCAWGALCLLFWQGSWQLLYHPTAQIARTPASLSLPFDSIGFATNDAGQPQLSGWWIPAANAKFTVVYLHGQDGNLGDTVDALQSLHLTGVNLLAFDYRGYGQSQFVHPSEARWREDAESALAYLTGTRHLDPKSLILFGSGLGADLALEVAAEHPEIAGIVLDQPLEAPANAIFNDARARMVPAHLLVRDRFDLEGAAAKLRIPSLWFAVPLTSGNGVHGRSPTPFEKAGPTKMLVWLAKPASNERDRNQALSRWLSDVQSHAQISHN